MPIDENLSGEEVFRRIYKNEIHLAMLNRRSEKKYLKSLLRELTSILVPKSVQESKATRNFVENLLISQIVIDGIEKICEPKVLNRIFHLFFTKAVERRNSKKPEEIRRKIELVEILEHFCSMNGPLHKNELSLDLTDVIYEKELLNQFSRVLDRNGSIGLISVYVTISDLLNEIPSATTSLVRRKIHQRLKNIELRYFDPKNIDAFVDVRSNNEDFIRNFNVFLTENFEKTVDDEKNFDLSSVFGTLSRFHCRIYELVEKHYYQDFLNSDEHFLYVCGRRMDSPDYRIVEQKFFSFLFCPNDKIRSNEF